MNVCVKISCACLEKIPRHIVLDIPRARLGLGEGSKTTLLRHFVIYLGKFDP